MKPDLVALVIGLIACVFGALALISGFIPLDWTALRTLAPFFLVAVGVIALIVAIRRH